HPIRLDQTKERLARQGKLANRRLKLDEHGPGRGATIGRVDFALEVIEGREPRLRATLELVAADVDEPGVGVEGATVRPERARERERSDREILTARAFCHRGNVEHR